MWLLSTDGPLDTHTFVGVLSSLYVVVCSTHYHLTVARKKTRSVLKSISLFYSQRSDKVENWGAQLRHCDAHRRFKSNVPCGTTYCWSTDYWEAAWTFPDNWKCHRSTEGRGNQRSQRRNCWVIKGAGCTLTFGSLMCNSFVMHWRQNGITF